MVGPRELAVGEIQMLRFMWRASAVRSAGDFFVCNEVVTLDCLLFGCRLGHNWAWFGCRLLIVCDVKPRAGGYSELTFISNRIEDRKMAVSP